MFNIVIFGAPGSGKGTQSDKIIERYGLMHVSSGELLRDHIAHDTQMGRVADSYISQGYLIPDELMIRILLDHLDRNKERAKNGLILDGFPRTVAQAIEFDKITHEHKVEIDAVIGLEADDEELIKRLLKRGIDSGRTDDNLEVINRRLRVYHEQTAPLRNYYINEGIYCPINGEGSVNDIFAHIVNEIDRRMRAKSEAKQ